MPDGTLHLEPAVPADVLEMAARGELEVTVEITGAPREDWGIFVDGCVSASARI